MGIDSDLRRWAALVLATVASVMGAIRAEAAPTAVAGLARGLRAGAATSVITPELGGEIVGGFHPSPATHIHDDLRARCLVLDDGTVRLALVVCDLLGMHRCVSDEARRLIAERVGIPPERVLVSATHTHSATSALGGELDAYQAFVARRIADGVQCAANALRPAVLGVGSCEAGEHVFNRRWTMRPGTMPENPFGTADDLVKMNPPAGSPNLLAPAGPTDPTVSFLALREPDGPPIALYTAYSLHYVGGVGAGHVSADYFAIYCDAVARLIGADRQDPPFVALMANGTSGDINNINFRAPRPPQKPYEQMRVVAEDVAARVARSWQDLVWQREVTLDARYREPAIGTRRPTAKELAWARKTLETPAAAGQQKSLSEIYAGRVLALAEQPETLPMPLQALRIGPAVVGSMPCEVLCEIGLEFRARAAIQPAFLVSIGHGYYGYLPTPRQHDLGGYETWPGTNKLERRASETMLAALLEMTGEMAPKGSPAAAGSVPAAAGSVPAAAGPVPAAAGPTGEAAVAVPSPATILASFGHDRAVRVELVAAEPQVVDPVALCFDERGRLFVAEMRDYPLGPPAGEPPRSRIVRLEDADGDGVFERSAPFAEGLAFVTGLCPWQGGLIVTRAGGVDWLGDADGDGRCDVRETWFTGFAEENSQLRANHPTLGPDGAVYVANGLRGGDVVAVSPRFNGDPKPLSIRGRDFRFDPLGRPLTESGVVSEAVTGHGQFGLCFDAFGNRFVCSNRNPCVQVMLEDRDIRRNPLGRIASAVQDVSPAGEASRLAPLSSNWTTSNLHAGQFSAACGVTVFCGDGLPPAFRGDAFTCDPTANLVHRQRLVPAGPTFTVRPEDGPEFLASRHDWFRPVALAEGPDGCLYVADMCRAVIEHPDFMPTELKTRPDLRHGDTAGRIWRIRAAEGTRPAGPPPHAEATPEALAELVGHPNGWHRETACRLLLERPQPAAIPRLRDGAGSFVAAESRARALLLLASLSLPARGAMPASEAGERPLDAATLGAALEEADPRVRRVAVRLASGLVRDGIAGDASILREGLVARARDEDAGVRFETALRLGDLGAGETSRTAGGPDPAAVESMACDGLAAILEPIVRATDVERAATGGDWIAAAVVSASAGRAAPLLERLLARFEPRQSDGASGLARSLAEQAILEDDAGRLAAVIERLWRDAVREDRVPSPIGVAVLEGVLMGVERSGRGLAEAGRDWPSPLAAVVETGLAWAAGASGNAALPSADRERAIRCLAVAPPETAVPGLLPCLAAGSEPSIRLAAIAAAGRFDDPAIADALLADAPSHTPAIGRAATAVLLSGPRRAGRLLAALESGHLPATRLAPEQWKRLATVLPPAERPRADTLQAAARPADREMVVERYRASLTRAGDPHRGRGVFTRQCAGCHRVGGVGVNVGPDISDSRVKQPAQYLTDILDPNRAIDSGFFAYTALLHDGRVLTGLVASETGSSVTLRQPDGVEATVLQDEIESLRSTGLSLMPVGLERVIAPAEMADLIAFLKNWRYDAALGQRAAGTAAP